MRSTENVSVHSIHVFIPNTLLGLIIKKISFRINIVSDSPPQVSSYENHHMPPPQLSYLKTICCWCCSNVKAPSVFPATSRLHFPLWNVHGLKRLLLAREPAPLAGNSVRFLWVTGSVPRPRGPSHVHTVAFPRTLMEIFSSCRNKSRRADNRVRTCGSELRLSSQR